MIYGNFKDTKCDKHIIRNFYRWMTNLEIAGFVLALAMGFYMLHLLKYRFDINWLNYKLPIVLLLFLPLEVLNFWFVNIHPKEPRQRKSIQKIRPF
jgi:protoporphyrinogen IX oxidase